MKRKIRDGVMVSFKLGRRLAAELDLLVERGVFTSRSEALRAAVRLLVEKYRPPKK